MKKMLRIDKSTMHFNFSHSKRSAIDTPHSAMKTIVSLQ